MVLNGPKLFQNITVLKEMRNGVVEEYASMIENIEKDDFYVIHTPIKKSEFIMLLNDSVITIIYMVDNKGMYKFNAKIVGKLREGNLTFLRVKRITEIEKNQRRQFYRVETAFDVTLTRKDSNVVDETVSVDISAGGMKVTTSEKYELEDFLDATFVLGNQTLIVETKVVKIWKHDVGRKFDISLEFLNLSENIRESIFRFVFEKEREKIKKGIS